MSFLENRMIYEKKAIVAASFAANAVALLYEKGVLDKSDVLKLVSDFEEIPVSDIWMKSPNFREFCDFDDVVKVTKPIPLPNRRKKP